jgi:oligopeptide/dipeptide ABC transporter ATP-binding protein
MSVATDAEMSASEAAGTPLLDVRDLSVEFQVRSNTSNKVGVVSAVDGVSFQVHQGETLGIVGETGCGKSTLARAILQAVRAKSGSVLLRGEDLMPLRGKVQREKLRRIQMVFQDPYGSMDPKWRVAQIVREALTDRPGRATLELDVRVDELLKLVGLDPVRYGGRLPRELSGGECQRVAIARVLAVTPDLIICDEAVSSLDVSIQAQILNLFVRLRHEFNCAYLFVAHDLTVVKYVSDRVAVMYLGRFCEIGPSAALYEHAFHPYTDALLSAVPTTEPGTRRLSVRASGEPASPINPPSGCRYRTRCPRAQEKCALETPPLLELKPDRFVACHFPMN